MRDDAPIPLGLDAIRAAHAAPGGAGSTYDLVWLEREDCADLGTEPIDPARVVVALRGWRDAGAPPLATIRRELAARGIDRILLPGECGFPAADLLERGFVGPGQIVSGRGSAGYGFGGIGTYFVRTSRPLGAARRGSDHLPIAPPPYPLRVVGARGRHMDALDVAMAIRAELLRAGIGRIMPLELSGPTLDDLAVSDRCVVCGALAVWMEAPVFAPVDARTVGWLRARSQRVPDLEPVEPPTPRLEIDISRAVPALLESTWKIEPVCDSPPHPVRAVIVGGAFGGRLEDLRVLARTLREHPVHDGVTCVAVPATVRTVIHAAHEGLIAVLLRAGVRIEAPGSRGLAELQRALADDGLGLVTGFDDPLEPNWRIAAPAVAAASAILGRVAHPDEVLRRRKESV